MLGQEDRNGDMSDEILKATAQLVSSYVSKHQISKEELLSLIHEVGASLTKIRASERSSVAPQLVNQGVSSPLSQWSGRSPEDPVVPIEDSIQDDYIVCLEDGKQLKMLKRHLKSFYNMTPEDYRRKWNLPEDYPMVCRNYSRRRSDLAKDSGLGVGVSKK